MSIKILFAAATAALLAVPAAAAPATGRSHPAAELGTEASIPFVNHRGVRNFRAVDRDVVYLQDAQRRWYKASLAGPCIELPFAQAIAVDTKGGFSLDRFGAIVVRGERCPLLSLVKSEAPPKKQRKAKKD
jgi:hypothetical protein